MRERPAPTIPAGFVAEEPGKVGAAARSWTGLLRLLADRWTTAGPQEVSRNWRDAQDCTNLPIGIRIRAATAADPIR